MQDLELRVQTLEQKCRTLKRYVVGLTCCAVLAALSGAASLNRSANAAGEEEIDPKETFAAFGTRTTRRLLSP